MKHRFAVVVAICACVALVLVSAAQTLAQKNVSTGVQYSGTIKVIDKDGKTFTIQPKGVTGGVQIKYTEKTKFTYKSKPGSVDDLKEGRRVVVVVDKAQKTLVALRVDVREK